MELERLSQDGPPLTGPTLAGTALSLIHAGRAPTRSALTRQLGVTRATVGAVTGELRALGLITIDPGQQEAGQPGRPSHRLVPDPDGPVALAAQVHPDGYAVALVGLGGTVIARRAEDTPVAADPERALAAVTTAAAGLLRASGRGCVGAAVSVPTSVAWPAGAAVRALYVGWPDGAPVRDIFTAGLARHGLRDIRGGPLAGTVVNDVNAIALAEHRHGAGRDAGHLLVLAAARRGVGGALVVGGALYTGSTGLALEAGHVSGDPDGLPCVCGNRGCLSVEADATRLLALAGRAAPAGVPVLDAAVAVLRTGYATQERVRQAADTVIGRLGLALAGLINVLNPDRVLLGGLYGELLAAAPERLREAVAGRSPWGLGAAIPIERCTLDEAGLIGAAELAWQPVLDNPALLG